MVPRIEETRLPGVMSARSVSARVTVAPETAEQIGHLVEQQPPERNALGISRRAVLMLNEFPAERIADTREERVHVMSLRADHH